jgi:hypothetical protein
MMDAGTLPAAGCESQGGVCLPQGSCAGAGGTVGSLGGCAFSDGPAECCIPAAPTGSRSSCAGYGGVCAPIGGCDDSGGYFAASSDAGTEPMCAGAPEYACCVPHAQCGADTLTCCSGGATFSPACDMGVLFCYVGTPCNP